MNFKKSFELLEKSKQFIPGQTQTFSRASTSFVEGAYPVYAQSAKGARMTDVDGNEFLDYYLGLGPITLGYNYERVNHAVINQLQNGILFSLPHPLEIELSELISKHVKNAEMVKFEKSGSNALTGAVRAARAYTERDKIAYCGSAGVWHDWQAIMVSRNKGVPKFNRDLISVFNYNDTDGLEQIFKNNPNEIAAIVIEPTYLEKPNRDFFKKVRELANQNNSLLILDEVVTGFRFDIGGGQKYFDIDGDLICFGKGIANGFPLSAITGKKEFMKIFDELWVSSTNNSETLSLAAGISTINEINEKQTIPYCWNLGTKLFDGWNKTAEKYGINAKMIGYPVRMTMKCYDSKNNESIFLKSLILQELIKKGIFMSPGPTFISYSHTENDISYTINSLDEIFKKISSITTNDNFANFLEGNIPKTIWTMAMKPVNKIN
jgi:glutamate-1-semialdehyde 2,1-aminomutase